MSGLDNIQRQLLSTFFDEAAEALVQIERGLLALDDHLGDPKELIDDVFRAAHSIKGGAGTFGLSNIAELAHVAETLLDRLRSGRATMSSGVSAVLLESVDILRHMLQGARDDTPVDSALVLALKHRLERAIVVSAIPPPNRARPSLPSPSSKRFAIDFRPRPRMLETGNDSARLLRELAQLGTYSVTADTSGLPAFNRLEPTLSYLAFQLTLEGAATREQIDEVFSWVGDDADITIEESPRATAPTAEAPVTARAGTPAGPLRELGPERDATPGSIRVSVDKVDLLMNMVGELVITQSMLGELDSDEPIDGARIASLRDGLTLLARNTRALQESVMSLRSMPIGTVFARLPRLVHDVCKQLGKECELKMSGQTIEVDKSILEKLGDPLVHIVRNSLDHGIESVERRRAAGKPDAGRLEIQAFHRGSDIVVELSDDGGGLDLAKIAARGRKMGLIESDENPPDNVLRELIFAPGFSTATIVSDVSGRGVGMDVVRRNVVALGGQIGVQSTPGVGTRISLRLPLTLAILDGQLVQVGGYTYVIPVLSILESVQVDPARLHQLEGKHELYRLRDQLVPIVDLRKVLEHEPTAAGREPASRLIVVVEGDGERIGLSVDDLAAQQQVVVKSLETNYGQVDGLAGATILGDGRVALILDVAGIAKLTKRRMASSASGSASAAA